MAQTFIRHLKLGVLEDLLDLAQAKGVAVRISNQANGRAGIGIEQPVASGNCIIVPEARQRSQAGRTIGP